MYKAVIFDLDGTLLDTLEDLWGSVNHALRLHGMPVRTLDEVRSFVGDGVKKLIERAVPAGCDTETAEYVLADFKAHYALHSRDKTAPYDGINELLGVLREKGIKLAVVSNKLDSATKELCYEYFKITTAIGECEGRAKKPAPDSVLEALRQLGVSNREAVYVGDSEVDIKTAQNSGMDCISVTWGFRTREFLKECGAKAFADSAKALEGLILN